MHGQQNDKYTEMQGQQNDKYTEMHGQQNDKYTVMHGQKKVKISVVYVLAPFPSENLVFTYLQRWQLSCSKLQHLNFEDLS